MPAKKSRAKRKPPMDKGASGGNISTPAFRVTLRGLRQNAADRGVRTFADADPLAALRSALAVRDFSKPNPVIEWPGTDRLAVLDLDFHGRPLAERPEPWRLEGAVAGVYPSPALYWTSHGRGLHLVYPACGEMTAAEVAAVARLALTGRPGIVSLGGTVEIVPRTFHPEYARDGQVCGPVREGAVIPDMAAVYRLIGSAPANPDDGAVSDWLEENGWTRDGRYEHDRCPIAPGEPSHGSPVWVGSFGIACKHCEAKGNAYPGLRKPGFVPYGRLIDPGSTPLVGNRLRAAVKGVCHWEHARLIIEHETGLTGELAELTYRALLKLWHLNPPHYSLTRPQYESTKKQIDRVFTAGRDLLRDNGERVHSGLLKSYAEPGLPEILKALPGLYHANEKGKLVFKSEQYGHFKNNSDLARFGYPAIVPIRGVWLAERLAGWDAEPAESAPLSVVVADRAAPFRYRPRGSRDLPRAERRLLEQFPGLRLDALRLFIVAKGISQLNPPEPPRVMLTGQSGAGKNATVALAGELCGDEVGSVVWNDELARSIGEHCGRRGLVMIDEIAKSVQSSKDLLRGLLGIARGKEYRPLYASPKPLEFVPAIIMADTVLPPGIRDDHQLSRRVVYVNLGAGANGGLDWRTSACGPIQGWRTRFDPSADSGMTNADVADTVVSDVIDRFFSYPRTFEDMAAELGFRLLRDQAAGPDGDGIDVDAELREFFNLVCEARETDCSHFKGRGWKVFDAREDHSPLAKLWRSLTDNGNNSQRLTGAQWSRVMNCRGLELDNVEHGKKVGLRFRVGNPRSREKLLVNSDVLQSDSERLGNGNNHYHNSDNPGAAAGHTATPRRDGLPRGPEIRPSRALPRAFAIVQREPWYGCFVVEVRSRPDWWIRHARLILSDWVDVLLWIMDFDTSGWRHCYAVRIGICPEDGRYPDDYVWIDPPWLPIGPVNLSELADAVGLPKVGRMLDVDEFLGVVAAVRFRNPTDPALPRADGLTGREPSLPRRTPGGMRPTTR